jgi:hypothetical protein
MLGENCFPMGVEKTVLTRSLARMFDVIEKNKFKLFLLVSVKKKPH